MKKIVIMLLVVSLLAVALVSCGGNRNNNGGTKETEKATDKVTDKVTNKPADTEPGTMLDPENGKVSDTDTETGDSILDPVESGLDEVETDIVNGARRMTGK